MPNGSNLCFVKLKVISNHLFGKKEKFVPNIKCVNRSFKEKTSKYNGKSV